MELYVLATGPCMGMPTVLIDLLGIVIQVIKIVIPIVLVLFGMLDLGKAVFEQKEEDITKAQKMFVKRLVAAILVFLVVVIVQFVIGVIANATGDSEVITCFDHIFN